MCLGNVASLCILLPAIMKITIPIVPNLDNCSRSYHPYKHTRGYQWYCLSLTDESWHLKPCAHSLSLLLINPNFWAIKISIINYCLETLLLKEKHINLETMFSVVVMVRPKLIRNQKWNLLILSGAIQSSFDVICQV